VLIATAVALPVLLLDGSLGRFEGALFVTTALALTASLVRGSRKPPVELATELAHAIADAASTAGAPAAATSPGRAGAIAFIGLIVLLVGGHFFVDSATRLAVTLGMSERLVGLTIRAVGTSLPELATGVIAARRGHGDIAIGNVIGSNVFNVLLCLGAAGLASPLHDVSASFLRDACIALAMTLVAVFFLRNERMSSRAEAACLLAGCLAFLGWAIAF
jgi:cation:H+ antiporter